MARDITAVTMPKWGSEMTEGTIRQWTVAQGARVAKGMPLVDVETEKIINSAEAAADGVLRRILAGSGAVRPVGALIGVIAEPSVSERSIDEFIGSFRAASVSFEPDGRVAKADVEAHAAGMAAVNSMQQPTGRHRLSATRATIARRLLESTQTIPHYRLVIEADVGRLAERKSQVSQAVGLHVTLNDLMVRAVALALVRHPAINVLLEGEEVLSFAHADIAIAVATDDGLVAPIVRNADQKSLAEIAAETAELARRAASGALQRAELSGGTFTLSNLGMFGILQFDAIINSPQVAILAVGAAQERVVARQGAPVVQRMVTLTLSADHRVVDGATAAAFLATLRSLIEEPHSL
jgi:pyruvate dehydrogenase E2 component (dihydrolipoamide acetyltransferase)